MGEREDGAIEKFGSIEQATVGAFVDEGMSEFASESLGHGEVGDVAVGDEERGWSTEEARELFFKFRIECVIASGLARRSDVETELVKAIVDGAKDVGMGRETEVIATGEIGELASAMEDIGAIDLLERLGESVDLTGFAVGAFGSDVH